MWIFACCRLCSHVNSTVCGWRLLLISANTRKKSGLMQLFSYNSKPMSSFCFFLTSSEMMSMFISPPVNMFYWKSDKKRIYRLLGQPSVIKQKPFLSLDHSVWNSNTLSNWSFIYLSILFLQVFNGSDYSAPQIGRFCGSTLPDPIFATGNNLMMRFRTDPSIRLAGFDISYTSSPLGQLLLHFCFVVLNEQPSPYI